MFYKVKSVTPLPNYTLRVLFENGTEKEYNVQPLFAKWPVFTDLQTVTGLFDLVKVDAGGYGVSWNDDLDLSCNELWENGNIDINPEYLSKNADTVQ